MTWEVGQRVFVVPSGFSRKRKARWETIKKIGRKWATIGYRDRFNLKSGRLDGGNFVSPGQVWASEEDWREHVKLCDNWSALREKLRSSYTPPPHITADDIARIISILDQKEPA